MKKLLSLLAVMSILFVSCEKCDIEEPKNDNPIEQPDEPIFKLDKSSYTIGAEGGTVEVFVVTNIEYRINISESAAEWLSLAETRAERTETLTFTVARNESTEERSATVAVLNSDGSELSLLVFTQRGHKIITNNEIWYTNGSTAAATTPYKCDAFGANIVSNSYNANKMCWVITFDSDVTTIGEWAFGACNITSVTIPDSVTSIEGSAFSDCYNLTSITIGNGVTTIGKSAFFDCYNLTSITIGNGVTTIGEGAFAGCASLTGITIPDSVTTIGEMAFHYCDNLTSITIPDSVTSIGGWVFSYCTRLKEVYCKPTTPPSGGDYMFSHADCYTGYHPIGCPIYVPTESVEAYKAAYGWSDYAEYIEGYKF